MQNNKPSITLLPNFITSERNPSLMPPMVKETIDRLDGVICESQAGAHKLLSLYNAKHLPLYVYNEHSTNSDVDFILSKVAEGGHYGIISDAGLPCIADPGENIVKKAYYLNIDVFVIPGESSIIRALLLSGLDAEKFIFHGYTPQSSIDRSKFFNSLTKNGFEKFTHIFIEAPYRNTSFLESIGSSDLSSASWFIGVNLADEDEMILRGTFQSISKKISVLPKKPAIFLCKIPSNK